MANGAGAAAQAPQGRVRLGEPLVRIDGPEKVCGTAAYPGDIRPPGTAYAALVTSPIARGRIVAIDRAAALGLPGILDVLTHEIVSGSVRPVKHALAGGWANSTHPPLSSPEIRYGGQIVALVVGDTREAAEAGARRLSVRYQAAPHASTLDAESVTAVPLHDIRPSHVDRRAGDPAAGFRGAAAVVDAVYETPVQHHNPIELPTTTCVWDGDRLTVYEPTRFVGALQHGLAAQLGIDPEAIRVVAHRLGGHFGAKLSLSQQTSLVALAARRVGRPVHLATSRRDQFTTANHRTETRHRVRLGADPEGRFTALQHDTLAATSRFDDFAMEGADVSTALYGCPNVSSQESVAAVDRNTPGPMRAPPEVPYLFALESAVDELAHALGIDPIALRRRNDTDRDPVTGEPFTTRPLLRCFEAGAAAFGWERRIAEPRSREENGWLVGLGCAAAARPVKTAAASLRLTRTEGGAIVETAHHEIGNGLGTWLAALAAERLDLPVERVVVRLGDTTLPPAGISGGSSTTTTLANALAEACRALRALPDQPGARVETGYVPPGGNAADLAALRTGHTKLVGTPGRLAWSFGAHFVEVRVHALTGEIRVARHVSAFAGGRILNPLTARSQLIGGMIWGQSSALLEATEIDRATGTFLNADLAEYLVPTAADVGDVEAIMVEDRDALVNPEGVKGIGEIGIIGVNAAVANAVFNATGRRLRSLPIRPEHVV